MNLTTTMSSLDKEDDDTNEVKEVSVRVFITFIGKFLREEPVSVGSADEVWQIQILSTQSMLSICILRYGLVVRISGSHPGGPGSIPGNGILFHKYF